MRVVAYDPFVADERFRELGVEHAATEDDVLAAADFLTLHSPLTDETRGMINRATIAKMKDGARIVNAARGALIDEAALAEALESGKLAGAALDVFSEEPYDGPLLDLDGVVVTPHLAASTDEAQDRAGVIIAEQVVAALEGGLVTNAVNIPVVDKASLDILGPFIPLAASSAGWPSSSPAAGHAASSSRRTGRSPTTTRACSRSPRSTASSAAASTRPSTTSTRRCSRPSAGSPSARSGSAPHATT